MKKGQQKKWRVLRSTYNGPSMSTMEQRTVHAQGRMTINYENFWRRLSR